MNHTPPRLGHILAEHGGSVAEHRMICRLCRRYGPWEPYYLAADRYRRHMQSKHPEKPKKRKIPIEDVGSL